MKATHTTLIAVAVTLAFAGCNQRDPVAGETFNVAGLPSDDKVAGAKYGNPSADGSAPTNVVTVPASQAKPAPPAAAIPAPLHGRWGLTPADCTSTRGDAKGLLAINNDGLQFHESRATPARNVKSSSDAFSADFAFTGEGQTWSKFQSLTLQGEKLVRTESSPMASFTYAPCK